MNVDLDEEFEEQRLRPTWQQQISSHPTESSDLIYSEQLIVHQDSYFFLAGIASQLGEEYSFFSILRRNKKRRKGAVRYLFSILR